MTITSIGVFIASSFKPNCCWIAVKISGSPSPSLGDGAGLVPAAPAGTSGLHKSPKSNLPVSPVWSITGRSSTPLCRKPAKSAMVAFLASNLAGPMRVNIEEHVRIRLRVALSFGELRAALCGDDRVHGKLLFSRWNFRLKRSASSFCMSARNCLLLGCPSTSGLVRAPQSAEAKLRDGVYPQKFGGESRTTKGRAPPKIINVPTGLQLRRHELQPMRRNFESTPRLTAQGRRAHEIMFHRRVRRARL